MSRQCSVQFIFISRGNNNYPMKNDILCDNGCNDRIMTTSILHWEWRIIESELAFLSMEESMSGQQQTEALEASS